jgi:GntR family transcriptional regulator
MDDRAADLLQIQSDKGAFKLEYIYYDFKDKPCAYGWFFIPHQQMPLVSHVGVWNE